MQWIVINILFVMISIGFPLVEFWYKVIAVGLNFLVSSDKYIAMLMSLHYIYIGKKFQDKLNILISYLVGFCLLQNMLTQYDTQFDLSCIWHVKSFVISFCKKILCKYFVCISMPFNKHMHTTQPIIYICVFLDCS